MSVPARQFPEFGSSIAFAPTISEVELARQREWNAKAQKP
jgi:hypothetical protein